MGRSLCVQRAARVMSVLTHKGEDMRHLSRFALVIALALGAAHPIAAQDFGERYDRLKSEAAQGDSDAAYELGVLYYLGHRTQQGGPERDTERGVALFRPLAESGDPRAQWRLASAYEMGSGVERDAEMAYRLYQQAAEQGFVLAKQNLGKLYLDGRGTEHDADKAYELLREAAEGDQQRAMVDLARMYQDQDLGPEYDPARAVHWFRIAAEKNNSNGVRGLSEAYLHGHGVEQDSIEALRVYVAYEERTGRAQTTALLRILSQMSEEDRARADEVAEAENWLGTDPD